MKVEQVAVCCFFTASGPSYSVPGLCRGLYNNGVNVGLHEIYRGKLMIDISYRYAGYIQKRFWGDINIAYSPEMLAGLVNVCRTADVIHSNGLWMFPNVYPYFAKRKSCCKLVTSPRGAFADWAWNNSWWKKHLFGWFCGQFAALRATDMWHATSVKEYEEIRGRGYKQPVAIVPIGMDLPDMSLKSGPKSSASGSRLKRVVFFGRLHKVKAVDNLVLAWGNVAERFPDWELVVAGPDCGVLGELKSLISGKRIPRVSFVGEIKGAAKYEFLASADIYVLPSHTENFAITIAEALACGTPVIASQGTPWDGLEREKAGRWVPIGVEPLAEALSEVMSMSDEERRQMGVRGREWIARDFSWKGIGAKMKASYEWLLGKSDKPEWVKVD